ncbi:MAG TPA: succinate dehydrogenase, hydrophobic membrane anchor protein [Aestuariivirga sp.]|jgi:succinate dehydrogenase / fumarate reductase membrane anchor subunit|nr:succinate dehydrogenase, hydrophobic membrane anchor protein [Aestuariivirga sp.]
MSPDKSGTRHFWQQRATAIANVPLVLFLLWFIVSHLGAARADVVASVQNPFNAILLVLSFMSILWHMRLGMEMVVEDYVQDARTLHGLLLLNKVFTAAVGVAALYAILRIFFGA